MRAELNPIAFLVKDQFPDFYNESGPQFVAFVQAYYEWLDEQDNIGQLTRNIYSLRDIDETIDEFVFYFKQKYLVNFDPNTETDTRKLVKHAVELFGTKGTEQSLKLLFQLLYNEEINIYYPGNDVLKPSDGKWFVPKYLEITTSNKTKTFLYRQITGTESGATAFVEGVVRKAVAKKIFDVVYLSNVRGAFQAGERITVDGTIADSPTVLGSVIDVVITNGGANNIIGDILSIEGGTGKGAKIRVTEISPATGKVTFSLVDGGTGYRLAANCYVSTPNFLVSNNTSNTFDLFETVEQRNQTVGYVSGNGSIAQYVSINGLASNVVIGTGRVLDSNSTAIIVNVLTGSFTNATVIRTTANAFTGVTSTITNTYASGAFLSFDSTKSQMGVVDSTGTYYENASIYLLTSNNSAWIDRLYTGENAGFRIGSLADEEVVFLWTDLLSDLNVNGVSFMDIYLDGHNANTPGNTYGFPKEVTGFSATIDTLLNGALDFDDYTVGTISSITGINPGQFYNVNPSVRVYDPLTVGYNRHNIIVEISDSTGGFLIGEQLDQQITVAGYVMALANLSGTFANSEGVIQTSSAARGQIVAVNSTSMSVSSLNGVPFVVGQVVTGLTSNATANATSNTYSASFTTAKGKLLSVSLTELIVKPTSLYTAFSNAYPVLGNTSAATANVLYVHADEASSIMGDNADVSARVVAANGVVVSGSIIDSGFGYINNEEVDLINANNPVVSTGTVVLDRNGIGQGFWQNNDGMLNSNKYIHDNSYYQEYSYEVQTGISLSRYSQFLKKAFHISGTELFGKVIKVSNTETDDNIDIIGGTVIS